MSQFNLSLCPCVLVSSLKSLVSLGERCQAIAARNEGKLKQSNGGQIISKNCEDDGLPWYRCDYATYANRADYIGSFYDHSFINPPLYQKKFDELKEVALYLLVGDSDFLLTIRSNSREPGEWMSGRS